MLTFDAESWKDEEFSEEAFGSVLGKADEGESSPTGRDPAASAAIKNKNKNNKNRNKPSEESKSGGTSGGSSSEEQSANSDSLQKKVVSFSHDEQVNPTVDTEDASSPKQETTANKKQQRSLRDRVSDREQRSRRRQALIVDDPEVGSSTDGKHPRPVEPVTRVTKKSKSGVDEEVIKIPMLTGTLFLYRGLRRRAEFIRKYWPYSISQLLRY